MKNTNPSVFAQLARKTFLPTVLAIATWTALGAACIPSAKSVLDVANIACVIANAELDDKALRDACALADDLLPQARKVAAAHVAQRERYAAQKMSAARCQP